MSDHEQDNLDDLIDSLDTSEPEEMRPIIEGFSVKNIESKENKEKDE